MATYKVTLLPDHEDGGFTARVPGLPGVVSDGDTPEEALANVREAIELCLEDLIARGEPVPLDEVLIEQVSVSV